MITLKKSGAYKLVETRNNTKILYLGDKNYAWIEPVAIGEILVASHRAHTSDCVQSVGEYRLYDVVDEPLLSDQAHLELEVGRLTWQGYLLPTGLPGGRKLRSRIIPTDEIISGNPQFIQLSINSAAAEEARLLGAQVGIDFDKIDIEEFMRGIRVELEHGLHDPATNVTNDDRITTAKIAWAHLKEIPDYYTRLADMEADAEKPHAI